MQQVGLFQKVSYEQFAAAMKSEFYSATDEELHQAYDAIRLPTRATKGSAGYDFRAPFAIRLYPGETIKIPTGIRVQIEQGWWLGCFPRSGLGFKYRLQLDNTVGVIDADYYYSQNEGHIFAKITNDSNAKKIVDLSAGDAFMQGIFIPFGITADDSATATRDGGFGSTGK